MKRSFAFGIILGSAITAASIILMSPTNGDYIAEELEVEEELLAQSIKSKIDKKD